MTAISPSDPAIGDVKWYKGIRMVYGPDPWAWLYTLPCWFNLDQYIKEEGEVPPYVSTANRKALGL